MSNRPLLELDNVSTHYVSAGGTRVVRAVDEGGKLQTRGDIYGIDSRTMAAIRSERAIIENAPAPERKQDPEVASSSSPRRRCPSSASASRRPSPPGD